MLEPTVWDAETVGSECLRLFFLILSSGFDVQSFLPGYSFFCLQTCG